jgi:hypothetical protein
VTCWLQTGAFRIGIELFNLAKLGCEQFRPKHRAGISELTNYFHPSAVRSFKDPNHDIFGVEEQTAIVESCSRSGAGLCKTKY